MQSDAYINLRDWIARAIQKELYSPQPIQCWALGQGKWRFLMSNFESELIGQQCKSVEIIHYKNICLGFGDSFDENSRHGVIKRHIWEIYSWDGIWRVIKSNEVLFGCGNKEAIIDTHCPSLIGLTIEKIDYMSFAGDLKIFFTDGTIIEIFGVSSKDDSAWSIYGPDGQFPPSNPTDDFDNSRVFGNHAKQCFKRWGINLPMENKKRNCNKCAFYFHLRGASYFWDFGVCTNKLSEYDGKVVNVKSLCKSFSYSLPDDN